MPHAEMLIDGHFIGGPCDQSVPKSVLKSPWDGRVVGTAAEGGPNEAEAAMAAAMEAFPRWRNSEPEAREQLLRRIADTIRERRQELAQLLVDEVGKPVTWARGEVDRMAITFDLSASAVKLLEREDCDLGYDSRGPGYTAFRQRVPLGPSLCIVPWNWPFNLAAHKIGPALAVGNTIVLKPSSLSPVSTLELARLIHECGCPPGVLNAVNVPGKIAEKMAQDDRIQKVSFTGSPAVGWKLKALLPQKRVTLELGGDSSVIVMPGADLEWASNRIAASAYGFAGQVCISAQHVWAHADLYDELRERLRKETLECPAGDPQDEGTVCGPVIQPEEAERIEDWIREAAAGGAQVIAEGKRVGNLIAPTLIENVPFESKVGCQEVFGPVLTLSRVDSLREAVGQTNRSRYGIHASIFGEENDALSKASCELEVGGVVVNDYPSLRFDGLPYGGVKASGFGREGVPHAVDEMTEWKSVVRRDTRE